MLSAKSTFEPRPLGGVVGHTARLYENVRVRRDKVNERDKLKLVIENFDRILSEYEDDLKRARPLLKKSKTCSIIESKCILKKSLSNPTVLDQEEPNTLGASGKTKSLSNVADASDAPKRPLRKTDTFAKRPETYKAPRTPNSTVVKALRNKFDRPLDVEKLSKEASRRAFQDLDVTDFKMTKSKEVKREVTDLKSLKQADVKSSTSYKPLKQIDVKSPTSHRVAVKEVELKSPTSYKPASKPANYKTVSKEGDGKLPTNYKPVSSKETMPKEVSRRETSVDLKSPAIRREKSADLKPRQLKPSNSAPKATARAPKCPIRSQSREDLTGRSCSAKPILRAKSQWDLCGRPSRIPVFSLGKTPSIPAGLDIVDKPPPTLRKALSVAGNLNRASKPKETPSKTVRSAVEKWENDCKTPSRAPRAKKVLSEPKASTQSEGRPKSTRGEDARKSLTLNVDGVSPLTYAGVLDLQKMLPNTFGSLKRACVPRFAPDPLEALRSDFKKAQGCMDAPRNENDLDVELLEYERLERELMEPNVKLREYHSDSDDSGNISNDLDVEAVEDEAHVDADEEVVEVFGRPGLLSRLESRRDDLLRDRVTSLQAHCRGVLARRAATRRRLQCVAARCIQRNVRRFLSVRDWPWWRLLVRVVPLVGVHRADIELKKKTEELELLKAKMEKLEAERTTLKHENDKLEAKVSDLTADLASEHSTCTLASEHLAAESRERLRLERELQESISRQRLLERAGERLEMELLCARPAEPPEDLAAELAGELGDSAEEVYKGRYERVVRELEFTRRRLQQQHEDDLEQLVGLKKQLEKKLADAYEEVEEQRQVVGQWKRKVQKLNAENNDLRLLLEEQNSRNNLLEKKQRKFDSETQLLQDELRQEKQSKDRLSREKDIILAEKYTIENNLADVRLELELKDEKLLNLQRELDEITYGGKTEEEVTLLRKQKMECERKLHEQEEELDELAGQTQLLEQAKLRLEMLLEQQRKEAKREAQQRDEELEESRGNAQKKVKALESQLESEHEERTALLREKHDLERRLTALTDADHTSRANDQSLLQRLRRDLRRTKALLRDANAALERRAGRADSPGRGALRQLRNQLEDVECARAVAVKGRQAVEAELAEVTGILEETQRQRSDAEERANAANRERNELRTQLEENEEELAEVLKKYKTTVQQMSVDQLALQEQVLLVSEMETERNHLKEQISELTTRLESIENHGDPSSSLQVKRMELRCKELESKLELEQTTRARLEVQITRLKETVDKLQNELAATRTKEQLGQDNLRKIQRSLRELRDEYSACSTREAENLQKRKDLEKRLEASEAETSAARTDLKLAHKRIEDLQSAIQGDLEDTISDNSDSDPESYSSDESIETFLANHTLPSKLERSLSKSPTK